MFRFRAAWLDPRVRMAVGYLLGYYGLTLLVGAAVQLVDDVKAARAEGHVDGYRQARRELLAELDPLDDDDDQDDDDAAVDGQAPVDELRKG